MGQLSVRRPNAWGNCQCAGPMYRAIVSAPALMSAACSLAIVRAPLSACLPHAIVSAPFLFFKPLALPVKYQPRFPNPSAPTRDPFFSSPNNENGPMTQYPPPSPHNYTYTHAVLYQYTVKEKIRKKQQFQKLITKEGGGRSCMDLYWYLSG